MDGSADFWHGVQKQVLIVTSHLYTDTPRKQIVPPLSQAEDVSMYTCIQVHPDFYVVVFFLFMVMFSGKYFESGKANISSTQAYPIIKNVCYQLVAHNVTDILLMFSLKAYLCIFQTCFPKSISIQNQAINNAKTGQNPLFYACF